MLYVCVQKFDMTNTMENFLRTKHGRCIFRLTYMAGDRWRLHFLGRSFAQPSQCKRSMRTQQGRLNEYSTGR